MSKVGKLLQAAEILLASDDFLYHETQKDHLSSIAEDGLLCTSYGQSFVMDDGSVSSPEEYRDLLFEEMESDPDNEDLSVEELEVLVEEAFNADIDPEDTVARTYVLLKQPTSFKYGDVLLRFPCTAAGTLARDVDDYITKDIPPEHLEVFNDGEWKSLT